MAGEIVLTGYMAYVRSLKNLVDRKVLQLSVDQTAQGHITQVQTVGTTEEALSVGDISTAGYAWFRNLDTTNYVEIGPATGVYMVKLKPGEFAMMRLAVKTIYAKANTAAIPLEYVILEA